ncbi:MAG: hypothetical protein WAS05_00140 [Candidatus Nanopelagicales bacterium]
MSKLTTCTRCKDKFDTEPPKEGYTYSSMLRRTTTVHAYVLKFKVFQFRWMPANPFDAISMTDTTFDLCKDCSGDLIKWAMGETE